jgi:hypothetical protein
LKNEPEARGGASRFSRSYLAWKVKWGDWVLARYFDLDQNGKSGLLTLHRILRRPMVLSLGNTGPYAENSEPVEGAFVLIEEHGVPLYLKSWIVGNSETVSRYGTISRLPSGDTDCNRHLRRARADFTIFK